MNRILATYEDSQLGETHVDRIVNRLCEREHKTANHCPVPQITPRNKELNFASLKGNCEINRPSVS